MVEYILQSTAKALLELELCNSNCIHICPHITLSSYCSSKVNVAEWLVSMLALQWSSVLLSPFPLLS